MSWAKSKRQSIRLILYRAAYDEKMQRIVLFYCGDGTQADILKRLRDKVPKYMFPNVMRQMEKLPITLNGKIDRLALKEYYDRDNGK